MGKYKNRNFLPNKCNKFNNESLIKISSSIYFFFTAFNSLTLKLIRKCKGQEEPDNFEEQCE